MATSVRSQLRDGVARIELHRPDALNAWTPDLGRELHAALASAAADDAVRAILLTGAGRAFSAGADVKVKRELTPEGQPDLSTRLRDIYNPVMLEVRRAPKPVVAAVNGVAAGLGCSLALACDLVVAAESAYFLLAFVNLGLGPDGGASSFLVERVGYGRAAQLAMLAERLPASWALEWGLVNFVYPDEQLGEEAWKLATGLASRPTVALGSIKETLHTAFHTPLAQQLELEATLQQRHATTEDYAEGVSAFKEKRPARFRGR